MFRRLRSSLPKDYQAPATLEQLGFFLTTGDQVRVIEKPDQKYQYKINRNERVNDVFKEAFNKCLRDIVRRRLLSLDLEILRLPLGAQEHNRHVPIYISKGIGQKKRVLVLFGERNQDLGILSFRGMREEGIRTGSAEAMIDAIINHPTQTPDEHRLGIIITNPGQLIWYRSQERAISYQEYLGVQRPSAVHEPFRVDAVKNTIPGNVDFTEHVHYIFEKVIPSKLHEEAKLDIIGLEYTGDAVIHYLAEHWNLWCDRVNGICLGNPQFKLKELQASYGDEYFTRFLAKRARAYFVSEKPIETPIPGSDQHGCNCFASGEQFYEDGILIRGWKSMLDWFNMISTIKDYQKPVFDMVDGAETSTTKE